MALMWVNYLRNVVQFSSRLEHNNYEKGIVLSTEIILEGIRCSLEIH